MRDRRGLGTVGLVAILIAFVCVVQVAQYVFTGQVTMQASHAVTGRGAREAALAAVQEARGLVCDRLAQPGAPEFAAVRAAPASRFTPQNVAIGLSDLTATRTLVKEAYEDKVELVAITAALEPKAELVSGVDDPEGTLTIDARARSKVETGVERRIWRTWSYKVLELAPAGDLRPVVGMIRSAGAVLKSRVDAHQAARTAIEQDLPVLINEVKKIVADADREAANATDAQVKQMLQQIRGIYAPLVEGANGGTLGALLAPLQPRWSALAPLPANPADTVLVHKDTALSPGEFDLQGDMADLLNANRTTRDEAIRIGAQVKAQQTPDVAIHRQYQPALQALGDAIAKVGERYVRFREVFVLPPADEITRLKTAYTRVDPVTRRPSGYPLFDPLMAMCLGPQDLGTTPEDGLRKALERAGGPGGFQGTVLAENGDKPMRLSGTMKGRWILGATGPLVIDGLRRGDASSDHFTILHAGPATAPLTLSGQIDATIVTHGAKVTIRAGTQITGGLFFHDVESDATIEPAPTGPERVSPDPLRTAGTPDRWRHVAVSPWTRSMGSDRDF